MVPKLFACRLALVVSTCFCLSYTASAASMGANFSGKVLSNSGKPLKNAHVILNHGKYYGLTNNSGHFTIKHIKPGIYHLTIEIIGYKPYKKTVTIGENGLKDYIIHLESRDYHLNEVVVTATRTRKMMEDIPLPITVIKHDKITDTGSMRLSDILSEFTGLRLHSSRGGQVGLQVQGFDSDYTLIMINGEPIIGRRAGILNLDRISIGNVKRIEIIKGPSSALWGSSALAGVVNIITEKAQPFSVNLKSRYGTNQTLDAGGNISWRMHGWSNTFFVNRNSSGGYRLVPNTISQTTPKYRNYTLSYRTKVPIANHIQFSFNGRYYQGKKDINGFLGTVQSPTLLAITEDTRNYNLTPGFTVNLTDKLKLDLTHYISGYRNSRDLAYKKSGKPYESTLFDQSYYKTDVHLTQRWNNRQTTTFGTGMNREKLHSDRYTSPSMLRNLFIYGQHDWSITKELDLIAGFRFDHHNTYGSQFSPKFSIQYKVTNWLHVRASTGRGFKAPDFSQLFLNYTNPTVGYSAFGSAIVEEGVKKLQEAGRIDHMLRGLDQLEPIQAEHSWAFNTGFDLYPTSHLRIKVNFFHNNVNNLIDVSPVAVKNNGQLIYTYFNLHRAYTRGIETQFHWKPFKSLELSLGYQYLDARERIKQTKTVQDEQGNPVDKTFASYQPMFNRSKHSGTFKIFYKYKPLGISANIRGIFRGKYGFSDTNGNGYVNSDEYLNGYSLWNVAASKTFFDNYTLQLGIDNVLDFTRPQSLSYLPGRLFYVQISLKL